MSIIIEAKNLTKRYNKKEQVLNDVSVSIDSNMFITIVGPSGSGKSTLMNILSGLQKPTTGSVIFDGKDITKYNSNQLADYRYNNIGHIFQEYNLMSNLTGKENIYMGVTDKPQLDFNELINQLSISHLMDKFPSEMSGGEQQRVSIARALIKNPKILFCDEATGALDEKNSKNVVSILCDIKERYNTTIIFVTHNMEIAKASERIITMKNGRIYDDKINHNQIKAEEMVWA